MSVTVDCRCTCERCESRTTETYRLNGFCLNCKSEFVGIIRKGDKPSSARECPVCGVDRYMNIVWGGVAA